MGSVNGLVIDLWIPAAVEKDYHVGLTQIESGASRPDGGNENVYMTVFEGIQLFLHFILV